MRKISKTQNIENAKYRIAKYRIRKISTDKISNAKYRRGEISKCQNIESKISKWQNIDSKISKGQIIESKISKLQNIERKISKGQNIENEISPKLFVAAGRARRLSKPLNETHLMHQLKFKIKVSVRSWWGQVQNTFLTPHWLPIAACWTECLRTPRSVLKAFHVWSM